MTKKNLQKLVDELNEIFKENGEDTRASKFSDASGFTVDVKGSIQYAQFVVVMKLASLGIKEKRFGVLGNTLIYKI